MSRAVLSLVIACALTSGALGAERSPYDYADGYARPLALAVDRGLVYVALSTKDTVVAVDATTRRERARVHVCAFPQALLPLGEGVVVSCRFSAELGLVTRSPHGLSYRRLVGLPGTGRRGLAVSSDGRTIYVASPPVGGVEVVRLGAGVVQVVPTGVSPRRVRVADGMLLVDSYVSHTLSVFPIRADGTLDRATQTITTDAPVQDFALVGRQLLLLTHEDRVVDRAAGPVHWLDSVVLALARADAPPFADPGRGRRQSLNLTEGDGLAQPDAIAVADGRVAIVGSATDNVLVAGDLFAGAHRVVATGAHPSAVAFLPDGAVVVADRLSDTLTFVERGGASHTIGLDDKPRSEPWALGERLFYSRALVPENVADGALSIYACSACHDEGGIDGRRHPAKRNRFRSMTKGCRGLRDTAPYLSLGEIDTLDDFADNILSTHAQGDTDYDVHLPVRVRGATVDRALGPAEVRRAMSDYLARVPLERSPFSDGRGLSADARAGMRVFLDECARCHHAAERAGDARRPEDVERALLEGRLVFTSLGRYDVGTPLLGQGGNNPPSLRGVWDAAPYFSDGSAPTLEAVVKRTNPSAERVHDAENAARPRFDARTIEQLVAFLRAL